MNKDNNPKEGLFKTEIEQPIRITRSFSISKPVFEEFKIRTDMDCKIMSRIIERGMGEYIEESKAGKHEVLLDYEDADEHEPKLAWNESLNDNLKMIKTA